MDMIHKLRELIMASAPEPEKAAGVMACGSDENLDQVIPFSSIIVLGTIIAVENYFCISITRQAFLDACGSGVSLSKLATMVEKIQASKDTCYEN